MTASNPMQLGVVGLGRMGANIVRRHKTIEELATSMERGDTIIDGGNSYYRDDIARAAAPAGLAAVPHTGCAVTPALNPPGSPVSQAPEH